MNSSMWECTGCAKHLEIVIPGIGDRDPICRCAKCHSVYILDLQPNAPEDWPKPCEAEEVQSLN
jgi:hypothetical protein